MVIKEFSGKYRWLSNFWPCRILYKGVLYPSVEHAYQAQKSNSVEWKEACSIKGLKQAWEIKKLSHSIQPPSNWDEVKKNIMLDLIRIKFKGPLLLSWLQETKETILQEGNTWNDTYWGVNLKTGEGENNLGNLIMKVRSEYRYKGMRA